MLDEKVKNDLDINLLSCELSIIEDHVDLMEEIEEANKTAGDLSPYRKLADEQKRGYSRDGELTLHKKRLIVAKDLRTRLINETHSGIITAHPGYGKTRILIRERYFWPGMNTDIKRFVANCHACRRSKVPRDRPPGLLRPLPIPDHPWQHISMDFKSMPPDKEGNDIVCVFVDRLGKRPISVPCTKKVNAKAMA